MTDAKLSRLEIKAKIEDKLTTIPTLPGCYMMRDEKGEIIYIGKAKNLRNRVRSYFRGAHDSKTTKLVSQIYDFEFIVTNSDKEALILEINLIQKYKPVYNIRLKDGTMYPYLKITNERDPQLIITNHVAKDGGTYFGPFPNVYAATQTQQLLQKAYPLRRCSKNEARACFYYHLKQCIGPCDHVVPKEEYDEQIARIRRFFNGETEEIKENLKQKMIQSSEQLDFERAADYRDQIDYIQTTVERQHIMSQDYDNMDVFGYTLDRGYMSIQVFMLRQGSILKREAAIYPAYQDSEDEITSFIARFYKEQNHLLPKSILVPSDVDHEVLEAVLEIEVTTPLRGKKRNMLELCETNSRLALEQKFQLMTLNEEKTTLATRELAEFLNIPSADYIESFDHSNIFGSHSVSGMVVYRQGQPDKKSYRKFRIRSVEGSDEFAYTQEVIRRRYTRLLREKQPLPDLILMDGGIIQVRAARDVLENELGLSIPVAGMVKDDRHRTAALLDGYTEELVDMDRKSKAFHLVQRIQEEVHRYAISYHRQVRSKATFASELDVIPGVGKITRNKLLKHFKSLKRIKEASVEDITKLGIPSTTANNIVTHLNQPTKEKTT